MRGGCFGRARLKRGEDFAEGLDARPVRVHGLDRGQKLVGTSKKKDAPEPQKGDGDQLAELLNKKTLPRDEAQRGHVAARDDDAVAVGPPVKKRKTPPPAAVGAAAP